MQAQYVSNDPEYLNCSKKECQSNIAGKCAAQTCAAMLSFHVINIRTNIEFVMFARGFDTPCILRRSGPLRFTDPNRPLHPHLSSHDSTATSVCMPFPLLTFLGMQPPQYQLFTSN